MRSLGRFLRSRRLSIWLLAISGLWAAAATAVPQTARDGAAAVTMWRESHAALGAITSLLGIHDAWTAPLFLGIVMLLTISTALCSADRTTSAIRLMRSSDGIPESRMSQLERRPEVVLIPGAPVPEAALLEAARGALESRGYRVRSTRRALEARAGRVGPLGSPLFHWALTALFVVVAAGQLTRSEGLMGVPVGGELLNQTADYGTLTRGPLYPDLYSDVSVAVSTMPTDVVKGSIAIGSVPHVILSRGGSVLAEGDVYANHPLRYRSLLVHLNAHGTVVSVTISDAEGGELPPQRAYLDLDESSPSGFAPTRLAYEVGGRPFDLELEPVVNVSAAGDRLIAVRFPAPSGETSEVVGAIGDPIDIGVGSITIADPRAYARLSVVDDGSVYAVYALFALAAAGLGISTLVPLRAVWALAVPTGEGARLHVVFRHQRRDPAFGILTADVLAESLSAEIVECARATVASDAEGEG